MRRRFFLEGFGSAPKAPRVFGRSSGELKVVEWGWKSWERLEMGWVGMVWGGLVPKFPIFEKFGYFLLGFRLLGHQKVTGHFFGPGDPPPPGGMEK